VDAPLPSYIHTPRLESQVWSHVVRDVGRSSGLDSEGGKAKRDVLLCKGRGKLDSGKSSLFDRSCKRTGRYVGEEKDIEMKVTVYMCISPFLYHLLQVLKNEHLKKESLVLS